MRISHLSRWAIVAAIILCATFTGISQEATDPAGKDELQVHEHTLDNGLQLLVVERPGVPLVSTFVWYHVGSMDERPGETGMAHYLEHMMFKGSKNYKVGEVDAVTVRNGGSNNAFTSNDFTGYFIDLPKSRYKEALKIEADRMQHLTLDLEEFNSEKKVVQSESDIGADNPQRQLWERLDYTLYGAGHPYSHPVLGWPQDIEDVTRRDMRLFYERHYHPNHATIVMVGDITSQEALDAVTEQFARIPRGPERNRPQVREINYKGAPDFEVKQDSALVEMGREYLTIPGTHADAPAIDVLGVIMGSGVTSRLYRSIVEEKGIATGIASGHSDQMLGGTFWVWAQLMPGKTRDELKAAIDAEIAALVKDGVSSPELERTKNRFIASRIFSQESASSLAQALGQAQVVYGDWSKALDYSDRIRAVTAADVQRVAKTYLTKDRSITGWLVPELSPADNGGAEMDATPNPLPVQKHVLPNGVTVLLLERPGLPVVSVKANVRAGKYGEDASQTGISQFTGYLLDMGAGDMNKQQIAETIENIGAELSVSGGGAEIRVLSEHLPTALGVMADCVQHPTFPEKEVELTKQQQLANLENLKNDTGWFARAAASASIFGPENPIGRPSDGTTETVSGFTSQSLKQWHSKWFRPDNCVIAAVGDFDSANMLEQIKAEFGAWKKPSTPLKFAEFDFAHPARLEGTQDFLFSEFDPSKVDPTKKRILINHPDKDQVVVRLQTLGITRDNPDYYPLLVMDNIFGTSPGFTDRFSKRLRDEMGLAYSTYANISASAGRYPGAFLGYIGTRPENVELAVQTMYKLIEEIRTEPVSDAELASAKDYLKGSFVFDVETTGQLADMLVQMERYNLGFDHLVKYVNAVDAVTKDDVNRVATKYLVPEKMVEVMAGPVTKITPAPEETAEGE